MENARHAVVCACIGVHISSFSTNTERIRALNLGEKNESNKKKLGRGECIRSNRSPLLCSRAHLLYLSFSPSSASFLLGGKIMHAENTKWRLFVQTHPSWSVRFEISL